MIENPKIQLARNQSEIEILYLKRETLKENIRLVPIRDAQILFYIGLAVTATLFGIPIGLAMIIIGIKNWISGNEKRKLLQNDLAHLEDKMGQKMIDIAMLKSSSQE